MKEQVQQIKIGELRPFRDHPFYVKDDDSLQALCDSIQEHGVLSPLLARPTGEGYEIVSGHRRRAAALKLRLEKLPVLVREMSDDEAVILMVDSNIHPHNLLPNEKAFAYKMKFDAIKLQGQRTSGQVVPKSDANRTMAKIGEEKANQKERVRIEVSQIRKYFPKDYTARQMEEKILQMLEANYKKRQRSQMER